jgi:predicted ABC-type ATPase
VPVFHLLAGPNGAGKTTYYQEVLRKEIDLPFINADEIARKIWPDAQSEHGHQAAALAAEERAQAIRAGHSLISETVFSHHSKLELLRDAGEAGYLRVLHVILVPEELSVARVSLRVEVGGHDVPEDKIRSRFRRLWWLVAQAVLMVEEARIVDNSVAQRPFHRVARFVNGRAIGTPDWPRWTPPEIRDLAQTS